MEKDIKMEIMILPQILKGANDYYIHVCTIRSAVPRFQHYLDDRVCASCRFVDTLDPHARICFLNEILPVTSLAF